MPNVNRFFERLKMDVELQNRLKILEENYKGEKTDRKVAAKSILLPAAASVGLDFTLEELKEYKENLIAKDGTELSAEELKAVAGGWRLCVFVGYDSDSDNNQLGYCVVVGATCTT